MAQIDLEEFRRRAVKKKKTGVMQDLKQHGFKHGVAEILKHSIRLELDLLTSAGLFIPAEWALKKTARNIMGYRNSIRTIGPDGNLYEVKGEFRVTKKGAIPIRVTGDPKLVKTRSQMEHEMIEKEQKAQLKTYEQFVAQRRAQQKEFEAQTMEQARHEKAMHKRLSHITLEARRKELKRKHGMSHV